MVEGPVLAGRATLPVGRGPRWTDDEPPQAAEEHPMSALPRVNVNLPDGSTLEALLPLGLLALGLVVYALVRLVRAGRAPYVPKWVWALVIVLSVPWGAVVYLLLSRETAPASEPVRDRPMPGMTAPAEPRLDQSVPEVTARVRSRLDRSVP